MIRKEILDFAEKEGIRVKLKRDLDWHGYEIYVSIYKFGTVVGYPYVIMVKNNIIRMSTARESLERLRDLPDEE